MNGRRLINRVWHIHVAGMPRDLASCWQTSSIKREALKSFVGMAVEKVIICEILNIHARSGIVDW